MAAVGFCYGQVYRDVVGERYPATSYTAMQWQRGCPCHVGHAGTLRGACPYREGCTVEWNGVYPHAVGHMAAGHTAAPQLCHFHEARHVGTWQGGCHLTTGGGGGAIVTTQGIQGGCMGPVLILGEPVWQGTGVGILMG